ncbi:MAG: DUF1549 domain-containing protein [Acidobacteria bacterium]|nr:DUF1549 domain-containing protein [Acidobacteriota bacterium]
MRSGLASLFLALCANSLLTAQTGSLRKVDFATEIHPLLESRCRGCHSGETAQAGFRVDDGAAFLKGGKSGPAVVPGEAAASLLILKVSGQRGLPMPPSGPRLSADEIATLRNWIAQGAHWDATPAAANVGVAAMAPRNPPLPAGTSGNLIDRFVDAYFEREGVKPPAPVSDAAFARRVYYDLHGLPPAPSELAAFEADARADKRARLAERLLADRERYAEHWISFWNDLLRNDEGVVYHGERKSITAWLMEALRSNMPYDRMVQGLLNPVSKDDPEGYLIGVTWRGVVSASQSPPMQASQNAAQVFLGMNLKCAACHDSFVNRWKLRDTFGLAAMFSKEPLEMVRCDVPTGKTAEARFPIGNLATHGPLPQSRRAEAAQWFTQRENGRFARTVVNRYWRLLFGRGIVEPIDDMDAEPWSRDLLDALAWDFAEHDFDLQRLLATIVTSRAYQMPVAPPAPAGAARYAFRGPSPRRLTAEEFEDTLSAVSGDWRALTPRSSAAASYAREWRLKSDALSRVLGRPIRDQVYTERATAPSTLQSLEMTNGPLLSERLERASKALLGQLPPAPANLFDSKLVRRGATAVDVDVAGAKALWLVTEDVDSYNPEKVIARWTDIELTGPGGTVRWDDVAAQTPSTIERTLPKGVTRLRAKAVIDDACQKADISPALRFFVFTAKPEADRLVRVEGAPPVAATPSAEPLVDRLYLHLLARKPAAGERKIAERMVGAPATAAGVEDLLWALMMSPEFQYVR